MCFRPSSQSEKILEKKFKVFNSKYISDLTFDTHISITQSEFKISSGTQSRKENIFNAYEEGPAMVDMST